MSATEALLERYKAACHGWPHSIDEERVNVALFAHVKAIGAPQKKVEKIGRAHV